MSKCSVIYNITCRLVMFHRLSVACYIMLHLCLMVINIILNPLKFNGSSIMALNLKCEMNTMFNIKCLFTSHSTGDYWIYIYRYMHTLYWVLSVKLTTVFVLNKLLYTPHHLHRTVCSSPFLLRKKYCKIGFNILYIYPETLKNVMLWYMPDRQSMYKTQRSLICYDPTIHCDW